MSGGAGFCASTVSLGLSPQNSIVTTRITILQGRITRITWYHPNGSLENHRLKRDFGKGYVIVPRIIIFILSFGDPKLNLHLPLLLGGGTTQLITHDDVSNMISQKATNKSHATPVSRIQIDDFERICSNNIKQCKVMVEEHLKKLAIEINAPFHIRPHWSNMLSDFCLKDQNSGFAKEVLRSKCWDLSKLLVRALNYIPI